MSVARSSACLFCSFKQAIKRPSPKLRLQFHSTPTRLKERDKHQDNNPVDELRPLKEEDIKEHFTPEQAESIKQTQEHLHFGQDFRNGTVSNNRPWTMQYFQDLTEIDPVADKPIKAPWSNLDENSRLKTDEEFNEDIARFMQNMPEDENEASEAFKKFLAETRITVGKESAEFDPRSATAPELPTMKREDVMAGLNAWRDGTQISDPPSEKTKSTTGSNDVKEQVSPGLVRLMHMTGLDAKQLSKIRVKSVISHRVVNQTRLGKIQKVYWLSIAGNGRGLLGIGEGKSEESTEGKIQSEYRAIRNMRPIKRYERRTIFGDVEGKCGATELQLYARPPGLSLCPWLFSYANCTQGFGLRCQQYIFEMCRAAGISDLAARVTRARNPMNTVKAAYQALLSQKDPEEVAKGRGKKMVDVRKVYYAGNV